MANFNLTGWDTTTKVSWSSEQLQPHAWTLSSSSGVMTIVDSTKGEAVKLFADNMPFPPIPIATKVFEYALAINQNDISDNSGMGLALGSTNWIVKVGYLKSNGWTGYLCDNAGGNFTRLTAATGIKPEGLTGVLKIKIDLNTANNVGYVVTFVDSLNVAHKIFEGTALMPDIWTSWTNNWKHVGIYSNNMLDGGLASVQFPATGSYVHDTFEAPINYLPDEGLTVSDLSGVTADNITRYHQTADTANAAPTVASAANYITINTVGSPKFYVLPNSKIPTFKAGKNVKITIKGDIGTAQYMAGLGLKSSDKFLGILVGNSSSGAILTSNTINADKTYTNHTEAIPGSDLIMGMGYFTLTYDYTAKTLTLSHDDNNRKVTVPTHFSDTDDLEFCVFNGSGTTIEFDTPIKMSYDAAPPVLPPIEKGDYNVTDLSTYTAANVSVYATQAEDLVSPTVTYNATNKHLEIRSTKRTLVGLKPTKDAGKPASYSVTYRNNTSQGGSYYGSLAVTDGHYFLGIVENGVTLGTVNSTGLITVDMAVIPKYVQYSTSLYSSDELAHSLTIGANGWATLQRGQTLVFGFPLPDDFDTSKLEIVVSAYLTGSSPQYFTKYSGQNFNHPTPETFTKKIVKQWKNGIKPNVDYFVRSGNPKEPYLVDADTDSVNFKPSNSNLFMADLLSIPIAQNAFDIEYDINRVDIGTYGFGFRTNTTAIWFTFDKANSTLHHNAVVNSNSLTTTASVKTNVPNATIPLTLYLDKSITVRMRVLKGTRDIEIYVNQYKVIATTLDSKAPLNGRLIPFITMQGPNYFMFSGVTSYADDLTKPTYKVYRNECDSLRNNYEYLRIGRVGTTALPVATITPIQLSSGSGLRIQPANPNFTPFPLVTPFVHGELDFRFKIRFDKLAAASPDSVGVLIYDDVSVWSIASNGSSWYVNKHAITASSLAMQAPVSFFTGDDTTIAPSFTGENIFEVTVNAAGFCDVWLNGEHVIGFEATGIHVDKIRGGFSVMSGSVDLDYYENDFIETFPTILPSRGVALDYTEGFGYKIPFGLFRPSIVADVKLNPGVVAYDAVRQCATISPNNPNAPSYSIICPPNMIQLPFKGIEDFNISYDLVVDTPTTANRSFGLLLMQDTDGILVYEDAVIGAFNTNTVTGTTLGTATKVADVAYDVSTRHNVKFTREGTTFKFFVDDVEKASVDLPDTNAKSYVPYFFANGAHLAVFNFKFSSNYIDELPSSNTVRYSQGFETDVIQSDFKTILSNTSSPDSASIIYDADSKSLLSHSIVNQTTHAILTKSILPVKGDVVFEFDLYQPQVSGSSDVSRAYANLSLVNTDVTTGVCKIIPHITSDHTNGVWGVESSGAMVLSSNKVIPLTYIAQGKYHIRVERIGHDWYVSSNNEVFAKFAVAAQQDLYTALSTAYSDAYFDNIIITTYVAPPPEQMVLVLENGLVKAITFAKFLELAGLGGTTDA